MLFVGNNSPQHAGLHRSTRELADSTGVHTVVRGLCAVCRRAGTASSSRSLAQLPYLLYRELGRLTVHQSLANQWVFAHNTRTYRFVTNYLLYHHTAPTRPSTHPTQLDPTLRLRPCHSALYICCPYTPTSSNMLLAVPQAQGRRNLTNTQQPHMPNKTGL